MNLNKLKDQVLDTLASDQDSRNDDIKLMIKIWQMYYPEKIVGKHNMAVLLRDLYVLPTESAIKRIRAQIQNVDRLYPPTDWTVAKARGWEEIKWRQALGYPTDDPCQGKLALS